MWGVAAFAYMTAVLQRTSMGVAGIAATQRFEVSASVLSSLAVVQLIVYAALQVPVGIVLDRFGPKALIATGAAAMLVGQVLLALAPNIGLAIIGRILVGAGDAMTFISVVRLLATWFSGRTLPVLSQWTGNIGQLGQVLSAIPLSLLLHSLGWTPAFLAGAGLSAVSVVLVIVVLADRHAETPAASATGGALKRLRDALSRPGTQLGFWSHFVTQSTGTVFTLLWGFPLLTAALGYSAAEASGILTLIVITGFVAGPLLGLLTARFPLRRSNLVIGIVVLLAVLWTAVLAWPGTPPTWLIVLLVVGLGIGGPGSLIGFDFARTFNPMRNLGSANGVVNSGGFLASFVMMYLIGLVLDLLDHARVASGHATDLYSWDSFRIALCVQYLVVGMGVVFLIRARRRTRARLHEEEGIQVAPLWVAIVRSSRRRRSEPDRGH
ncbi:MAG: transporter [Microbacteriaceae bacterium]|jgi:MFS family permease|nr:transporter [Microbacteriaceae bacterium]